MEVFPLEYPGIWLDGLDQKQSHRVQSLLHVCESHVADAAVGLALFTEARSRGRVPVSGVPTSYTFRLPFIHAHTVLYALDGIAKALGALQQEPGVPEGIAAALEEFERRLPGVKPVRDSSHHTEDRARGLGRNLKPLDLQPITTGAIFAPGGGVLVLNSLENDDLCFTGSDGAYHRVPINAASVRAAQEAVQRVLDAFTWKGPTRSVP